MEIIPGKKVMDADLQEGREKVGQSRSNPAIGGWRMSPENGEKNVEKQVKGKSPLTTLLFITVTLALAVKMAIRVPVLRDFFSGYGKFIFLPVLMALGYLATQKKQ
jgi:hypothetical protein